ncbi:MAG: gamma-glutamylcyclotransferase [Gemmatimonadota bacterium]|nr:gamma-glutamylcyclotransferase [Gemmatimonadota bacterium]
MPLCYFAYGSNMLTKRLQKRCPGAVSKERAYADDWIVEFSKPSKDCSGKATLSPKNGHRTPGMLFEIPDAEVCCLDKSEGAGYGYERINTFYVRLAESGKIVPVATYLATRISPDIKPYDWYLALVIAGAREHIPDEDHHEMLRQVTYMRDPRGDREERMRAKKVLAEAGYSDHWNLLNRDLCESATCSV